MNNLAAIIGVALAGGGAVTALVGTLRAWFINRAPGRSVKITVTNPDGAIVEMRAERLRSEDVESLIESLRATLDRSSERADVETTLESVRETLDSSSDGTKNTRTEPNDEQTR